MYVFLFLSSAYVVSMTIFGVIKNKQKKSVIAKLIISSIILVFCIVDLFYLCFGGISKLTDMEINIGLSRNPRAYTIAVVTDYDEKIYFASGIRKTYFLPEGKVYNNVRITYLPCTRTIIKLEQKPKDSYYLPFGSNNTTIIKSADGYLELYEYSKDTLPFTIAIIGIYLIILLIAKIIRSRKNKESI